VGAATFGVRHELKVLCADDDLGNVDAEMLVALNALRGRDSVAAFQDSHLDGYLPAGGRGRSGVDRTGLSGGGTANECGWADSGGVAGEGKGDCAGWERTFSQFLPYNGFKIDMYHYMSVLHSAITA